MRSEFPAGLSRSDIDYIMQNDADVLSVERIVGPDAMWRISISYEGHPPVELFVDNGINEEFVQILVNIDANHIIEALSAVGPIAVVGVCVKEDRLFLRGAFFIKHSTMHALTNCYRAVALAYKYYQQAIS